MRKTIGCGLGILMGTALLASAQAKQPSFYVGASAGQAKLKQTFDPSGLSIKEDESAYKGFAGARFGLLGIEGGYVSFGNPKVTVGGTRVDAEVTGVNLFGTLNADVGPATFFAKAGAIDWDLNATVGAVNADDSGTSPMYGVGASFPITKRLNVRAEYEKVDAKDLDQLDMWSAGLEFGF